MQTSKSIHKPLGFWAKQENQRKFLNDLAEKLKIKSPIDWGKITRNEFALKGGSSLLSHYNNSILKTLKNVYPEISWNNEWFHKKPGYWLSSSNQREFMENLKQILNISTPSDWGKISKNTIYEHGGYSLLDLHDNSIFKALKSIYPEIEWKKGWFQTRNSSSYWTPENLRIYFDSIAVKFGISNPMNWSRITWELLSENKAGAIYRQYRGSLVNALKDAYPDILWNDNWFRKRGYWKEKENQLQMIERIASQLGIKNPKDWGQVTIQMVKEKGGKSLFKQLGYSIFGIVSKLYPNIKWKREWFPNISKFPKDYWNSATLQREFLDSIRIQYKLDNVDDWKRVTLSLIRKQGGQGILAKHHNSLVAVLKNVYPKEDWSNFPLEISEPQAVVVQSAKAILHSKKKQ